MSSEAGPSRPRGLSSSSLTSPSRTKFRDSNERVNLYASTDNDTNLHTSSTSARRNSGKRTSDHGNGDDEDDEDGLPGYTAPTMSRERDEAAGYDDKWESGNQPLLSRGATAADVDERGRAGYDGVEDSGNAGHRSRPSDYDSFVDGYQGRGSAAPSFTSTLAQRKAKWWKDTLITGCFVASWYGFATLLSLYNKWMFSAQYYNFPFPLFVTGCHMCVQYSVALTIRLVWRQRFRPPERPTRKDYVLKIFPTAASTAGDIGLSNLSLRTITLSLYTMCKSSALIFVLLFAFLFKLERFSLRLIGVITLISFGVFLMVFDTTAVNIPGIVMVFTASALSGLRWALTETLMKKSAMGLSNPFATIFWLAPLMAFVLAPVSMGVEGWGNVFGSGHFEKGQAVFTTLVIIFPGVLAFAMVASEYFIIDRAGILPLSIAGVFKEVSTISISAWVFGDQLTQLNIVGVVVAVCGIALFSYHKYQKSVADPIDDSPHGHTGGGAGAGPYALTSSIDPDHPSHTYPPGTPSPSELAVPGTAPRAATAAAAVSGSASASAAGASAPANKARPDESPEERTDRLRDDFEGWNDDWREDSDFELDEDSDDEVLKRREERLDSDPGRAGLGSRLGGWRGRGGGRWKRWWDREM